MCEIIDRPTDRPSLQKNKATIPRRSILCASIAGGWERFLCFPNERQEKYRLFEATRFLESWLETVCLFYKQLFALVHLILVARRLHLYLLFAYSQTIKLYQGSSIKIKSKTI